MAAKSKSPYYIDENEQGVNIWSKKGRLSDANIWWHDIWIGEPLFQSESNSIQKWNNQIKKSKISLYLLIYLMNLGQFCFEENGYENERI